MADYLDSNFQITFRRESPPEMQRMLQATKKQMTCSHENGERTLQVNDSDIVLVESATNIYLVSDKPITVTLSSGVIFTEMEQFAYSSSAKVSVSVTNNGSSVARVQYAAGVTTE